MKKRQELADGLRMCATVLCVAVSPAAAAAQTADSQPFARHVVYAELGGLPAFEGGAYTANYEHRLLGRTYGRVGIFAGKVDSDDTVIVPVMLNVLLTGRRHHLEIGAGLRLDVIDETGEARLAATTGYRWQRPGTAPVLRFGLAFDLGPAGWTLYPWPALSVGVAF